MSDSMPLYSVEVESSVAATPGTWIRAEAIERARSLFATGMRVLAITNGVERIEGEELAQILRGYEPPPFEDVLK